MFTVIGQESALGNFAQRETYNNNNERTVYYFPEKEALFIASKTRDDVRWKIICEFEDLKKSIAKPAFALPDFTNPAEAAIAWAAEYSAKQKALEVIEVQKPKVEYYDKVLDSSSTFTVTQIAKDLGLSAKTLNKRLYDLGVQYKIAGQWVLYAGYQEQGYTKTKTNLYTKSTGEQGTSRETRWTEAGRQFIHGIIGTRVS